MGAKVTFVVLSEDRGKTGWSSLHTLVHQTLEMIVPGLDWSQGVAITPRDEVPPGVQAICAGNGWHSPKPEYIPQRGELFRYVARLLAESEEQTQFVMFHLDADRAWSERERRPSLNVQQFEDVRFGVRSVLLEPAGRPRKRVRTEAEVDVLMSRLTVIVPYYSIEAWLYQATARARELCRGRQCDRHIAQYDAWEQARDTLDEILQLKDLKERSDTHCLTDKDKDFLARGFPANDVFGVNKSYAAWIQQLMADVAIMAALEQAKYALASRPKRSRTVRKPSPPPLREVGEGVGG